ncbi:MAG TPA: DUF4142 domain-containing protein [Stellaceae bacterium]|nr:DUF4142 domain-containing protein [Stellaceae bacterium]
MRILVIGATLGAALVTAGWVKTGNTAPPTSVLQDDMFLGAALARTQSQLELAQMAAAKAHTASLVAYAKRVASERAPLWDKLAEAARASGVGSDTNHVAPLDALKPLDGEAFERAYVASQLEDQQNNLDFFAFEAQNGGSADLRQLAADELPRLQQDLADARGIVKNLPFEPVQGDRPMPMPEMPRGGLLELPHRR